MICYRIYPSLLDAFQDYLDAETTWEKYWGNSDEPSISLDEYLVKAEADLIDKINRVPCEPIEAADKGTCFNEIIDRINSGGQSINPEVSVKTVTPIEGVADVPTIEAATENFTFHFDIATCRQAAGYFVDAIPQHYCNAVLPTRYGDVELYGYADEIRGDKVFDIKTTKQYEYGKFSKKWQKELYPYCLVESGEMESVYEFEYTVFLLSQKEPFSARMYREIYIYNHSVAKQRLALICEHFIEFLLNNKSLITDTKIFAQ